MKNKEIAVLIDTPYQLISAISYVMNHSSSCDFIDLYFDSQRCVNVDMSRLILQIKKTTLFRHVYELNSLSSGKYGYAKKISNYYEWCFPKRSIYKGLKEKKALGGKNYSIIVASGPFMMQRNFISLFPQALIIFVEDGSGSYSGRIGVNNLSEKGIRIQRLLKRGPKYIMPYETYVYCPEYYSGDYSDRVKKLRIADISVLNKIFQVSTECYNTRTIVYFDQPKYSGEHNTETDSLIFQVLSKCRNVIVRPHPQLKEARDYGRLRVDGSGQQWEMICANVITDNTVLIGKYSTAQLSPKLIFDSEPFLFFTHHLYGLKGGLDYEVERLKKIYRNTEKICVPETIEELQLKLTEMGYM